MNQAIEVGKLLRASTTGCVVGCRLSQWGVPSFGAMLRIPLGGNEDYQIFGLIHDIHVDDDGLVRQLAATETVSSDVILDNRINRNVPLEISVVFVGYQEGERVQHLLPPRPPLSLDAIYTCTGEELCRFTAGGRFGYFRHVLRNADLPIGELLAAHLRQSAAAHAFPGLSCSDPAWAGNATRELITLLRDDYPTLMSVLGALGDAGISFGQTPGGLS
jgi:hypothetical protein